MNGVIPLAIPSVGYQVDVSQLLVMPAALPDPQCAVVFRDYGLLACVMMCARVCLAFFLASAPLDVFDYSRLEIPFIDKVRFDFDGI